MRGQQNSANERASRGPHKGRHPHSLTEKEAEHFAKTMLKSYRGQPNFELSNSDIYDFKMLVAAFARLECQISWDNDRGVAIITPKKWGGPVHF